MEINNNGAKPFQFPDDPCLYKLSPSNILILGGNKVYGELSFISVLDVDTMKLCSLDLTGDDDTEGDAFSWNQCVEWNGKVYMLGDGHIHVITKDCMKYESIKYQG